MTASRVVYENRWMRLHEEELLRADGSPGLYSYVEKSPGAMVIPVDGDEVVMIEQYRHPVGRRFWEFPQGAWDGEHDPDPEELARGELAEETGLRAGNLEQLGELFFAYGMSSQSFTVWLGTDLEQGERALEPEEEGLTVGRFPLAEVERMAGREIADAATVAALGLLRLRRPDLVPPPG